MTSPTSGGRSVGIVRSRTQTMEFVLFFFWLLTTAHNTQNHWVSGLCPLSGILNTRTHNVSETGSVSRETTTLLCSLERASNDWVQWLRLALSKEPNRVGVSLPSPEEGNRSSSRNVVFPSTYDFGRWEKSRNPVILSILDIIVKWCSVINNM
jgi:hypothetical protein